MIALLLSTKSAALLLQHTLKRVRRRSAITLFTRKNFNARLKPVRRCTFTKGHFSSSNAKDNPRVREFGAHPSFPF
jgi:hypothetical protein